VASKRDSIELPDVEKLREKWGIVEQVKSKIAAMDKDASRVEREAYQAGAEARSFEKECQRMRSQIESWLQQSGKVCPQCEQEVEHTHIDTKIGPLKQEFAQLERNRIDHLTAVQKLQGQAEAMRTKQLIIEEKLVSMQPKMTVQEAGAIVRNWQYLDKQHSDLLVSAEQIAQEQNPHGSGMDRIHQRIAKLEEEKTKVTAEIENLGGLYQHLNYVNASYRDRKKIKSYVLSQRIPQLNARLAHYLDTFDLDLSLEFTNTLGISSDKWGYDFFCGGERKRVDIALMLAVFDLHEKMYGRQCNVVVLDEVDSRLDIGGVDSLVQIIKNDIAAKAETVLMISHRSTLVDLFPRHMTVKREGRLSRIDEIR
jgi:chromosome segregation ATPase